MTAGRKRSLRGNWLVVEMHEGEIYFCTWVKTWAGVQASKRSKEKYLAAHQAMEDLFCEGGYYKRKSHTVGRIFVLDIQRMLDFAITEGGNEINDLYRLWEKS